MSTAKMTRHGLLHKGFNTWAVVVAQLAERSLPTPEICGSNPNIGKHKFVFKRNYLSIATKK